MPQYIGVLIAMVFISVLIVVVLYFTKGLTANEKILFMMVLIITVLLGVFVVDNIIAFKTKLLSDKEDQIILDTMKTIINVTLGFYIGSKVNEKK